MSLLSRFRNPKNITSSGKIAPTLDSDMVNPFLQEYEADSVSAEGDLYSVNEETDPELIAAEQKESRLKSLLHSIPKPAFDSGYQLLAFQAGGFGLRGVVVRNTKHGAVLGEVAESGNVDFTRAISEVIAQLRQRYKRLPKNAILITPSVISSIVELPVSPLRPRPENEMQELIRWELEGTLTQQNKHWLIGSMLVERGYLTSFQRDEIVEELKLRQSQGGESALIRFGDLAVQLKYLTREQLEECFVLQGKLISVDDELAYGWQAEEPQLEQGLSDEVLLSKEDDGDSSHKWMVCGMSKSVRKRWLGAFNLNGIKLQALYPSIGTSFAVLAQHSYASENAVLEVHQEQLALIIGSHLAVQDLKIVERQQGQIRADELHVLLDDLPQNLSKLYVNAPESGLGELLFTLSTVTSMQVEVLPLNRLESQEPVSSSHQLISVLGASEHYLKHISSSCLSWIPAKEKETSPLRKLLSPQVLKNSAVALILIGMFSFLGWMHWNMWQQEVRLEELNARYEKESKLKDQFKAIEQEQNQLKKLITQTQLEKALNQNLIEDLSSTNARNKELIRIFLKSLSVVTPNSVFVTKFSNESGSIDISAQTLSNTQGQQFVNALNKAVKLLEYEVISSDIVRTDSGELPFSVTIRLQEKSQSREVATL